MFSDPTINLGPANIMVPHFLNAELTTIHDSTGDIIWFAPAWGIEPHMILGARWEEFMTADDAKRFRAFFADPSEEKEFSSPGMLPSTGSSIFFSCVKHRMNHGLWFVVFLVHSTVPAASTSLVAA